MYHFARSTYWKIHLLEASPEVTDKDIIANCFPNGRPDGMSFFEYVKSTSWHSAYHAKLPSTVSRVMLLVSLPGPGGSVSSIGHPLKYHWLRNAILKHRSGSEWNWGWGNLKYN